MTFSLSFRLFSSLSPTISFHFVCIELVSSSLKSVSSMSSPRRCSYYFNCYPLCAKLFNGPLFNSIRESFQGSSRSNDTNCRKVALASTDVVCPERRSRATVNGGKTIERITRPLVAILWVAIDNLSCHQLTTQMGLVSSDICNNAINRSRYRNRCAPEFSSFGNVNEFVTQFNCRRGCTSCDFSMQATP